MTALLVLLLACSTPPALPASAIEDETPPTGRLVAAGPVRGFLASPGPSGPAVPAQLRLVRVLDGPTKAAVLATAATGMVVLAIPPEVDTARARAYLAGMPKTGPISERCDREACP